MKIKTRFFPVCGIACAILFTANAYAEKPLKIAYINFEKVFNSYKKTAEENQKLQQIKEEKENEAQSMISEINRLKAEAEILSKEARLKADKEITDRLRDLKLFTEDTKKELVDERNLIFQKLTDEIRKVVEAKGRKGEYTLIMDDKALFFKDPSLDITDSIIDVLNDDSKREKIIGGSKEESVPTPENAPETPGEQ
jgi:Skp family chaperone for outer membrane proteins